MSKIAFSFQAKQPEGVLIFTLPSTLKFGADLADFDKKNGHLIKKALSTSRFEGKKGQILTLLYTGKGKVTRIMLVGMGESEKLATAACEQLGGQVYASLASGKEDTATLFFESFKMDKAEAVSSFALGMILGSYRFDKYRTTLKPSDLPSFKKLLIANGNSAVKRACKHAAMVGESVFFARDLINEPANVLTPDAMANACLTLASTGLKIKVMKERELKRHGMGALLGVAQGSSFPPRVVCLEWMKGNKKDRPVALIGKGVTFDTGGISLKPGAGMEEMKRDMAGAAAVLGAMRTLALRKAKVNVVGIVGLVENMPDANAQRPGDIVKTMDGQTVEVINTDAEGRLVLADAMSLAQEKYEPACMVDIATLTGAIRFALGSEFAGLFSNDDKVIERMRKAGKGTGEEVWNLPLHDGYDKAIDSTVADMKNISDASVGAGSATAAHFLKRFVKKGVSWAHLDIASVAWSSKGKPTAPRGATAFGVRLLDRFVEEQCEK